MNRKFLFISIFVLLTSFFLANYLLAAARTFLVSGNASSFNVEYSLNKNFDLIDELTESGETEKATLEMAKAFRSQGTASGYYASAKLLQDIGKYQEAIYDFEKAIELNPKRINTIRDLAWLYATCIDDKYRDGEKALKLSNKAISLLKLPSNFIALAAAYAELENFKLAVLFQEKAIEIALDIGDDSSIEYYQKILKSYQSNKPWRE